jgi:hypothetical protein
MIELSGQYKPNRKGKEDEKSQSNSNCGTHGLRPGRYRPGSDN